MRKPPPKKQRDQGKGQHTRNGHVLDVRSGSAFIGQSEKTTRCLINRGLLPYRKLGGRILLIRTELEAWLTHLPGVTLDQAQSNQEVRHG